MLDNQGYRDSVLAYALVLTVSIVLVSFMCYLYKDFKKLQSDTLMRYTEDKSLVYFHKPPLPQSFDLVLCCAKDEIVEADDIRNELHNVVHTMGVTVHKKGIRADSQRSGSRSARSQRKHEQARTKKGKNAR